MTLVWLAAALMTSHGLSHIVTIAIVWVRLARPLKRGDESAGPVTLIRPARGLDQGFTQTMGASFALDWEPGTQILFCVDDEDDPAVPELRRLIDAHPDADARLLIGRNHVSANPKLNNIVKGWNAATTPWIIVADSNVDLPRDFVARQFAEWRSDTGVVSQTAVGMEPDGFAGELECAFLNAMQARWLLAGDSIGLGFALGKSLMFNRALVDRAGGFAVLSNEAAEDIAATKMAWSLGLRARLAQKPLHHPVGRRRFADVWQRQLRWARLRRVGVPPAYAFEIFLGGLMPIAYATALAAAGYIPAPAAAAYALIWYGLEVLLTWRAGWPLSWATPFAFIARDLLVIPLWLAGLLGKGFRWRGNEMSTDRPTRSAKPTR